MTAIGMPRSSASQTHATASVVVIVRGEFHLFKMIPSGSWSVTLVTSSHFINSDHH
jgi:hypothetical protein